MMQLHQNQARSAPPCYPLPPLRGAHDFCPTVMGGEIPWVFQSLASRRTGASRFCKDCHPHPPSPPSLLVGEGLGVRGITKMGCSPRE